MKTSRGLSFSVSGWGLTVGFPGVVLAVFEESGEGWREHGLAWKIDRGSQCTSGHRCTVQSQQLLGSLTDPLPEDHTADLAQEAQGIAALGLEHQRSGAWRLDRACIVELDQNLGGPPAVLEPEAVLPVLGKVPSPPTDLLHQAANDGLVEEAVGQTQRGRAGLLLPGMEPSFNRFESGQQVRRDVARLSLCGPSIAKAHAATIHQIEEELLLLGGVLLPSQPSEVLARKAARVSQPGHRPAAVEHGVDGVERPVLVEEDAVSEEIGPVEHHAGVVEVVEGVLPGDDASHLVAERAEFVEGESPMTPLLGLAFLVFASPVVEPAADLGATMANLERAVTVKQVAHGVSKVLCESAPPKVLLGTVEGFEETGAAQPCRRGAPVRDPIALALHDNHRTVVASERSHVVEPVGERLIAQGDTILEGFIPIFEMRGPQNHEDGAAAQEERMGAVVDVLPAEIPPVDLEDLLLVADPDTQLLPPDLHAVGRHDSLVERLAAETPAELGFADATIAEEDHLHLILGLGAKG